MEPADLSVDQIMDAVSYETRQRMLPYLGGSDGMTPSPPPPEALAAVEARLAEQRAAGRAIDQTGAYTLTAEEVAHVAVAVGWCGGTGR